MSEFVPEFGFALLDGADSSFLPTKAEPRATGYDVRAFLPDGPLTMIATQTALIQLGFRAFCPAGWWFEIRPRSSSFAKKNLSSLYGVVDENFEGAVMFACQYVPDATKSAYSLQHSLDFAKRTIEHGEALGQLVPVRRQEMTVKQLSNDEYDQLAARRGSLRATGGFGSTDQKERP